MGSKLLLVEDSPDSAELSRYALNGCVPKDDIILAYTAEEAMDYIFATGKYKDRDRGEMPGLILLDLKLPAMSGFELLEIIRTDERTRFTPIAVLTVSSLRSDMKKAYQLGANSYLVKPIAFDDYASLLRTACHYWLSMNKTP